ncbi:uncharacterized protein K02A2.6-like [Achroia grisella]|uniref:uncharacterized protein K02A2.6-like n=1 Tax=Achroia grisella TaxID=688607 RepID=UPI0027D1F50F|nr:uncharacterized protein K02A2.6-like [Achroia grisella]
MIKNYIAQLRKLSIGCNFTDLDRTLRDRLVCGILDKDIRRKLLQQRQLTFEQACDIVLSQETANFDANIITPCSTNTPVLDTIVPMDINKVRVSQRMSSQSTNKNNENMSTCFRCGKPHRGECRFRWTKCHHCGKIGHIEAACLLKSSQGKKYNSECNGLYEVGINSIRQDKVDPFVIRVFLNRMELLMEVDSGCPYTIINEITAKQIWKGKLPKLELTDIALKSYTEGSGSSLIGRNWFAQLGISIEGLNNVKSMDFNKGQITQLLYRYKQIFEPGLGKYTGPVVNITPKEGSVPKFLKSRPIPFAIRERVFKEIDRLVQEEVLEPTTHSEWATPIVPVLKANGQVRLCGDYRSTVNAATNTDTYPLPTLNEAFVQLQGGVIFSKIDLEQAYTQVAVDNNTASLLTVNTPRGLYKVKRLAFGVKACPGIFQRLMTSLLAGITGIAVLLDDIVISGKDINIHNARLEMVLQRLQKAGLRVNKEKCLFAVPKVKFLGYLIDESGIHPSKEKTKKYKGITGISRTS